MAKRKNVLWQMFQQVDFTSSGRISATNFDSTIQCLISQPIRQRKWKREGKGKRKEIEKKTNIQVLNETAT